MSAEAQKQVITRRLHLAAYDQVRPRSAPTCAHAIGVTLCGDLLQVYLVNASGAFTTNARKCDEEAVLLRRVLSRLIELDDDGLRMLASTNKVDDVFGSFVVSDKLFQPRAHDSESELGDVRDIEIWQKLIQRRNRAGLTTSAFHGTARHAPVDPISITPITSTSPNPAAEYAVTISWAEQSLLDDVIALRRKMHAASGADTEGLSLSAGIYRGGLRTLPAFFGDDESFDDIGPRALEVVFHRQCYRPLNTATTTRELAQAVLGVVKADTPIPTTMQDTETSTSWGISTGISRTITSLSTATVSAPSSIITSPSHMIDLVPSCTIEYDSCVLPSGTWPYLACSILAQPQQPLGVVHERWHDIESLFYVVMEIAFREPYKGNDEVLVMTPKGETIWRHWNSPEAHVVYALKYMLRMDMAYEPALEGCAHRFTGIQLLLDILRRNSQLGELWGPSKAMSHESIISDIEQLLLLL
ncbi:BQ5605_C003g01904 [Microbotryum silenes-dioicae]|uniref:BQ5605_C003g01904 protein n=1 Tax=Microbotryum silenes-dioicae TaxID=796604 RepID=A0A2X0M3P5_9BASI|nr:BQ5605_C003g01904 [Microbotryum silenes-dioicae]